MSIRPKTRGMTIGIIVLALVVLVAVALVLIGNYFYNYALNPKSPMSYTPSAEDIGSTAGTSGTAWKQDDKLWLTESGRTLSLTSEDGLSLSAYLVSQEGSHRYAVVCHGYQSRARDMGTFARHFYDLGFSVLAPDARGHGNSEGDYIGMGWPERRDIVAWCKQLVAQDPQAEILLFGISMGGATVMMTSGEADLPANVKSIVEDCGYTSAWGEFAGQLKAQFGLPTFPIMDVTNLITQMRAGYDLKAASALDQVKKSVTPTLFIHGDADTFVPFSMLDEVYNAAACPKEKLVIPGAGHAEASSKDAALYWGTVEAFLAANLS